jgi:hypothetical protein
MSDVPADAEELNRVIFTDGADLIGVWRKGNTLYFAGYHFGPSGPVLLELDMDELTGQAQARQPARSA